MIEYSNKIFNEQNGLKNKQNRTLLQEDRSNSQKKTFHISTHLEIKKKKKYNKTVGVNDNITFEDVG